MLITGQFWTVCSIRYTIQIEVAYDKPDNAAILYM